MLLRAETVSVTVDIWRCVKDMILVIIMSFCHIIFDNHFPQILKEMFKFSISVCRNFLC